MPIPDYQSVMLPLLSYLSDGVPRKIKDCADAMVAHFNLTQEEATRKIPSGKMTYILNRTGWARTYLKKAGLISSPQRGLNQITEEGKSLLEEKPKSINVDLLMRYESFVAFRTSKGNEVSEVTVDSIIESDSQTPEEALELNYLKLRAQLADDLLEQVKTSAPDFFEKMVVELLVSMGYGGSLKDAGQATQRSNDGGIDGIIKEDRLGLDTIYIQAKRWENSVQRPEIQKFAGALQGVRAKKGVFITTSSFSDGAKDFAATIDSKIILIDGYQLAQYMIDHNVGVSKQHVYEIKKLDSDYFIEE